MRRETAIARLRVLGPRVITHLASFIRTEPEPAARSAALSALEGMDDRRTVDLALAALASHDPTVGIAATRVLRGWVAGETGTRIFDALAALATDRSLDAAMRTAAFDALADLPPELVQPLREQGLPVTRSEQEDASTLRQWVALHGHDAPLSQLHDAVVRALDGERHERSADRRQAWLAARGAAHHALAKRGSRVALYDLREAFSQAAQQLPLDFLGAIREIGDASCLEPLAGAWSRSPADAWWRDQLSGVAGEIVSRTRLSGRSAVVKRMRTKWPGFV